MIYMKINNKSGEIVGYYDIPAELWEHFSKNIPPDIEIVESPDIIDKNKFTFDGANTFELKPDFQDLDTQIKQLISKNKNSIVT